MRDGVGLAIDLVWPPGNGPFPVILIRTPYDKVLQRDAAPDVRQGIPYDGNFVSALLDRGYVLAVADVRGRFNSDGDWDPYFNEREDGYDTVAWIASQHWCDGNVGMIGRSYVGYTQWMAAADAPPALKAIVPIGAQRDLFRSFPVVNGSFMVPMGELLLKMGRRSYQIRDFMTNVLDGMEPYFETLPLIDLPKAAGTSTPRWWDQMMHHPNFDAFWQRGSYDQFWTQITAPALNVTGWYDLTLDGALANFVGMRQNGGTMAARSGQRLIVGPWAHWVNVSTALSGFDFGADAVIDLGGYILRFYDHWLKGVPSALEDEKPVHLFVMGANEWWAEDDWPPPQTRPLHLYLHSGGRANGLSGDGTLSAQLPALEEPDRYRYDPLDPVRSAWSMHDGPIDDRDATDCADVLCFTSDPIEVPLDVVGQLSFVLYASSSARDTDWHVRLVDVARDGYARFLSHGILRARFRRSLAEPALLTPGEPERFNIDLGATANRFLAGHRIRIEVTSSWFPRYDRNTNSGALNNFLDAEPVVATQTIFHDHSRPSHAVLPVLDRKRERLRGFPAS
jgi:uncharacterized protein